jgi:hypothetical protein
MTKRYVARGMMLIAFAATASCSDATRATNSGPAETRFSSNQGEATAERLALNEVARALALSLGSAQVRSDLKTEMRAAPFQEHKLELARYLNRGRIAAIAQKSGTSADLLAAAIERIRPLELYMPVSSHRAQWTGEGDLLVVAQLEDSSRMVAFNLKGEEMAVSRDTPPAVPAISLVPVETRFDKPLNMSEWKNQDDQDGKAIGTLVPANLKTRKLIACGEDCGGSSGSYGYSTPGFRMIFSRLVNTGEPWTKGNPEIEVHVHGPTSASNSHYGADLACSGEHALPERTFDQNSGFWNGEVLIWSQSESENFNAQFPDGHHILVWEDDDTSCQLKYDRPVVRQALAATASAIGGVALKGGALGPLSIPLILGTFLASDFFSADWLVTNDDYLGGFIPASARGDSWSDANYTLMKGVDVNGRAMIIFR